MQRFLKVFTVLAVAAVIALPLSAAEDKKKKKKKGQAKNRVAAQLNKRLEKAELTDEQKGKVKEIVASFTEKIAAAQKAVNALVPADARKKRQEALKKARAEGKKGKALQEAGNAALGLDAEQAKKYKEAQGAAQKLRGELNKSVVALLTPEQREKAGFKGRKKGGKKKKGEAKKKTNAKKKKPDAAK